MLGDITALILRILLFPLRLGGSGSFPKPLPAPEERKCLELAATGDTEARNKLIEHNLRLVAHVIKKYYSQGGDVDDLISIGVIGLIKAIRTFDMAQNTRLATYASRCVENEIFMYFRTLKRQSCEVSLSEPIDTDCEGNALELVDILSAEDDMLDSIVASERAAALRAAVASSLDEREREIIRLRYGLSGGGMLPQREVAARLGISRSYVSRIEKRALEKLRGALET